MKYGIYYAYWEKEWGGDFIPYVAKVKQLGFDVLEVACGDFHNQPDSYLHALRETAKENDIILTGVMARGLSIISPRLIQLL